MASRAFLRLAAAKTITFSSAKDEGVPRSTLTTTAAIAAETRIEKPLRSPIAFSHSLQRCIYRYISMDMSENQPRPAEHGTARHGRPASAKYALCTRPGETTRRLPAVSTRRPFVRHQHSLDRIGEIRKGGFLAHRSHTGSADETEIRDAAQVVRTGCEGHPPSDAEAIFG